MKDYRDANGLPRVDTKSKAKTTTTPLGSEIDRLTRENLALNLLVDGRTQQADDLRAELKNSQEIAQKYEDRYFSANQENERLTRELAEVADLSIKLGIANRRIEKMRVALEGDAVWKPDICRGECRFCGREDCESHKPECPLAGEAALEDK